MAAFGQLAQDFQSNWPGLPKPGLFYLENRQRGKAATGNGRGGNFSAPKFSFGDL